MQSLNVVFTGKDQVEVWREDVAAPGPHEIVAQATASLISSGTEGIVLGRKFEPGSHWDNWARYPFYTGYCFVGRVLEVGSEVQNWKVGDRIAARTGHQQFALFNPESKRAVPIPDGVCDEDAAWFGMAHIAQCGVRTAAHELGDSVVIIGLGLLGQLVTQYARQSGARQIIVIDPAQPRVDMALAHGATHGFACGVDEAKDRVLEWTGGGADVVYDITGFAPVFSSALGLARKFGKLLLLGDTGTPSEQRLTPDVINRGVRILAAHDIHFPHEASEAQRWGHDTMCALFFNYLERGLMRVDDLVTHRYAPQDAPQAYHMLQTDRSGAMGVVFEWSKI
jgi:2-desacetyl-2-hydroxyethyl bacteriochlorophyllide A dehydrogenase